MNKEKINDFVNVWAQAVGLTEKGDKKYVDLIKSDIAKRCAMYEKDFPTISIRDDNCAAYIIKPVNNQYSFEDFLLNRLMLGLREVSFTGALEGNAGDYEAQSKSLSVDAGLIGSKVKDKSTRHVGLQGKSVQIIKKTIEHELGHCFKSSFNDGFLAPYGSGRTQDDIYKNIIDALSKFENGKYASQIKSLQEFNLQEYSASIKTGVGNSNVAYQYKGIPDGRVKWIDELLNETEALELSNINDVQERWPLQDENSRDSSSGNYVNVYNYLSGYSTFTGYGPILKSLLGKEGTFQAEYMSSSIDVFKQFDKEYADIVQDVWGLDSQQFPPMKCIFLDFDYLINKNFFDENVMLKLDEFFAKCYERKVEKSISQNNGTLSQESRETILKDIEQFQSRLTTNDNPQKREQLSHNIVFNKIKTRINELSIQNSQPEITENIKVPQQENSQKDNQQSEETDSPKIKFVKGFIQAYNDTEEDYQYEKRSNDSLFDIKRLQDIFEMYDKSNTFNKMLISDLDGKWIGVPGDKDFKVQYSQKQVSAMARLLKTAQLLTESKKLNPEGRNYLEDFTNIPDIEYKLKQMKEDFKDENSYMYELRQKAKDNRANGTIPSYPPTQAETDSSDSPLLTIEQDVKQEIGTSNAKSEETSSNKIQISSVIDTILQSKITTSETQQQTKAMDDILRVKKLMFNQKCGAVLTDEQKALIEQHTRQTNEVQVRFRNQQDKKNNERLEM